MSADSDSPGNAAPPGEFEGIARFLAPLTRSTPGALGLRDDAALLSIPPGRDLVVTADAIIAGVHFLEDDPADLVARKLVRVNYSDLAAMGADPIGFIVCLMLPSAFRSPAWQQSFADGLARDQTSLGGGLLGGDTTGMPGPLTLSLTALGSVETGRALRRDRAQPGDDVYVSGTLGDAALGLLELRGRLAGLRPDDAEALTGRYRIPEPRLALGRALAAIDPPGRIAAMDVSDGLAGDLAHICEASGVAAEIDWPHLPVSDAARDALERTPGVSENLIATGGDDYELLFCAPPEMAGDVTRAAAEAGTPVTRIGRIVVRLAAPVRFLDGDGRAIHVGRGFRHF